MKDAAGQLDSLLHELEAEVLFAIDQGWVEPLSVVRNNKPEI